MVFNIAFLFIIGIIPTEFGQLINLEELMMADNCLSGIVPTELCSIDNLLSLSFGNNAAISCYADCLNASTLDAGSISSCDDVSLPTSMPSSLPTSVPTNFPSVAVGSQIDEAICGFIAATNIASMSRYEDWVCDELSVPLTDPCDTIWTGITCSNDNNVTDFSISGSGLTGNVILLEFLLV